MTEIQKIQLPNIFVVGPSGSGKSSSLRNLNPDTTAIININRKALPFRSATKFKYNKMVTSYSDVTTELMMGFGMNPAIEVIAIDDFTSTDESILSDCRKSEKGFTIYGKHNGMVREIINTSKLLTETRVSGSKVTPPKWVIWLGLDEIVNIANPDGTNKSTRRVKVEGRELQGTIEKEFTIVLFTEVLPSTMPGKIGIYEYKFMTNGDGITSAKTPMELFKDKYVDNDLNMVISKLKEYYGI